MKTPLTRTALALPLLGSLLLSGCAAVAFLPTIMGGVGVAGSFSSGGVKVQFDDKAIESAKANQFGAGATKLAIWPIPYSKMPVSQTQTLSSFKSDLKIISPNELSKSLRQYQVDESISAKTDSDLESDFALLCKKGVADVFVVSSLDTTTKLDNKSVLMSAITLGGMSHKLNGRVKVTLHDCKAQKTLTLSGDTELEAGMNAPDQGGIETHVGEVIAKVVGGILGIAPIEPAANKAAK